MVGALGGLSHCALNKWGPKQGHLKVNTPEGLIMAKTVSKRKEVECGLVSKREVSCPRLDLPSGHKTSGITWPHQAPPSTQ